MGCCGGKTSKNSQAYKAKKIETKNFTSFNPSNEFMAKNKDFPAYFIGLGKSKVKTILAFDEERMALVEKVIPNNMPVALWSAQLQVNSDAIFVAGGRYEDTNHNVTVISDFCVYMPISNQVRKLPSMIQGRSSFCLVHHNMCIFALGGRNDKPEPNLTMSDCEYYSLKMEQWFPLPKLNKSRCNHATLLYRNQVYVFGGYSSHYRRTTKIERQSEGLDYWEILPLRLFQGVDVFSFFPLSEDQFIMVGGNMAGSLTKGTYLINLQQGTVRNLAPMTTFRKQMVSCLSFTRKFYVLTDTAESQNSWADGWKICTVDNMKHFLPDFYKNFNATMANPILHHTEYPTELPSLNHESNYLFGTDLQPVIIEITKNKECFTHAVPMNLHMRQYQGIIRMSPNLVLFTGGVNSARLRVSNKTLIYDMTANQSIRKVEKMVQRRYNFAAVFHKGLIYVMGGQDIGSDKKPYVLDSCEVFDPATEKWKKVASLQSARCETMGFSFGGNLYVAGGYKLGGRKNTIEMQDQGKNTWSVLGQKLPQGIGAAGIFVRPDQVFIIGGMIDSGAHLDTVYALDIQNNVSHSFKKMDKKRLFPKLLPMGNDIIVLGGSEKTPEIIASTIHSGFSPHQLNENLVNQCCWTNYIKEFSLI